MIDSGVVRPSRVDERRHRHVRARRPRRAPPVRGVLHRRHGPPPRRRRPRSGADADARSSASAAWPSGSSPTPKVSRRGPQQAPRTVAGGWTGGGVEDCWGRSVWAFGSAARHAPEDWMRQSAMSYFDRGAQQRSPSPRSMAFAALGAAEVLAVDPRHDPARRLLADTVGADRPARHRPRLALAGAPAELRQRGPRRSADRRRRAARATNVLDDGLSLPALAARPRDNRRSPVANRRRRSRPRRPLADVRPATDRGRGDGRRLRTSAPVDRQRRVATRHRTGRRVVPRRQRRRRRDVGHADRWPATTDSNARAVNRNQGTESTLALIATMQHARSLAPVAA